MLGLQLLAFDVVGLRVGDLVKVTAVAVGLRVDLVTGYVVVGFPVGNLVLGFADVGFALLDVADTGFEVGIW